jgi:hypothetical protein
MPQAEEFSGANIPQITWLSQEEEEEEEEAEQGNMHIPPSPADLCEMAQSRENLNTRVVRGIIAVTVLLAAGLLYNVYKIEQPWIRMGQAWTLGVLVYLFLGGFTRRRQRWGVSEPCAQFLQRQHQERRDGYLSLRRRLVLFVPGIVACWWGNASRIEGHAWNLDLSRRVLEIHSGTWLFMVTAVGLVLVWIALGKAAEKAECDRKGLLRSIES